MVDEVLLPSLKHEPAKPREQKHRYLTCTGTGGSKRALLFQPGTEEYVYVEELVHQFMPEMAQRRRVAFVRGLPTG